MLEIYVLKNIKNEDINFLVTAFKLRRRNKPVV